ncbi:MAG: hypothetical protein IJ787_03165 [Bacilli bacterium]|nr:hypothetical protein [Bacilli bacterium]MDY6391989.1 hypothetical protein [Bacilli bacterium]
MKTFACPRCGKRFQGRFDRCPRCAQLLVYEKNGEFFDAEGDRLIIRKKRIKKVIPNPNGPKQN